MVEYEEVLQAMSELNITDAAGHDQLTTRLIKRMRFVLAPVVRRRPHLGGRRRISQLASSTAVSKPMPSLPPVMRTVLPSSDLLFLQITRYGHYQVLK